MGEKSGFFNAKLLEDENGQPVFHEDGSLRYDREYSAAEFAALFAMYMTNGIRNGGANLKAMAEGGSMNIRLAPGDAMIEGYYYKLEDDYLTLTIDKAGTGTRIDRVALRLDLREAHRGIYACVKKGAEGTAPIAPELDRNNEIYEIGLADVTVYANTQHITDSQIRDTRLDTQLCGLIHSLIGIDTDGLLTQLDAYFEEKKIRWDSDTESYQNWITDAKNRFEGWFNEVKAMLWQSAYADFDNWAHMPGYSYITGRAGGIITETIENTLNGSVLATKTVERRGETLEERLVFNEPNLRVKKITLLTETGLESKIEVMD